MKFEYNLFVGEHMNKALKVRCNKFKTTDPVMSYGLIGDAYRVEGARGVYTHEECLPQIRTSKSLSDEEWLFVFGIKVNVDNYQVVRYDNETISVHHTLWSPPKLENVFYLISGKLEHCNQQILNRMYSLFCPVNAIELIEAGLAVEIKS